MKGKVTRIFRFNLPSIMQLMWSFEFQCIFTYLTGETIQVDVQESMVGPLTLLPPPCETLWKIELWVWEQCRKAAFDYTFQTNVHDQAFIVDMGLVVPTCPE